jgi:hypothetical protein
MIPTIHPDDATATGTLRAAIREHALAAISSHDPTDGSQIKATVLHELHRQHPEIDLEDILELNVLVSVPESGALDERVDAVLSTASDQYDGWTTSPPAPDGALASAGSEQ